MKTGTTYLQQVMGLNKDSLAAAGYYFPGDRWAEQSRAARDVLSASSKGPSATGSWHRMVGQMLAHQGQASIFSMEFLSFANADKAKRVMESLAGADVHVILTVRDAARVIPAQWQTSCRNGGTLPWPRFVGGVRQTLSAEKAKKSRAARIFQRTQGIVRMLEVWEPLVERGHLHVVTVPPRGSDPRLLWERFAKVVGVDPAICPIDPVSSNVSLGHASTELLRRVNVELGDIPHPEYEVIVRGPLRSILATRSHLETPVRLNRRGMALAARWNGRVRTAIEQSRAHVVGDLEDLPVRRPDPSTPKALNRPSPEEIMVAAATAKEGLLKLESELRSQVEARGAMTSEAVKNMPPTGPAPTAEVAAVREVTALVRNCMLLARRTREPCLGTPDAQMDHANAETF